MDKQRVETGRMQFGDDWSGYFLRGADVAKVMSYLTAIQYGDKLSIQLLANMFQSNLIQRMNDFDDCVNPIITTENTGGING